MTFNEYVDADYKNIQSKQDLKAFSNESPDVAKCLVDRYTTLFKALNKAKNDPSLTSSLKTYCEYISAGKDVSKMKNVITNYTYRGTTHPSIYVLANVSKDPSSCKTVKLSGDTANRGRYWFVGSEECPTISFK